MRPTEVDPPRTTSTTAGSSATTTSLPPTTSTTSPPTTSTEILPPTIVTPPTTIAPPTTIVPPAPAPAPAARPATTRPDTYVVERSESLWSIAADEVGERLGRAPTDAEIVPFWRRLITANAGRLVVPGNADLIYAGQELVIPS
jgi:hypothetical protein